MLGICVPVLNNFRGLAELISSVDQEFTQFVIDNWNHNKGVAASWNLGIRGAIEKGIDNLLICNDDVTLAPGTLNKLQDDLEGRAFITASAGSVAEGYNEEPDFSCFMIRPVQFIERYGSFDENIFPAYFEDNDMARRIKLAGDKYEKNLSATMIHRGSITQNAVNGGVVTSEKFEMNRAYYKRKWGGGPLEEQFITPFNDKTKTIKDW